jgi:hypothetical protein
MLPDIHMLCKENTIQRLYATFTEPFTSEKLDNKHMFISSDKEGSISNVDMC